MMLTGDLHDGRPLVFVTVGTDHHRFDRLVSWIDEWMIEGGGVTRAHVFVQSGTSAAPRHAASAPLITRAEMQRFLREATAVVCHGGPASITECRSAGVVPIVVPRLRLLGEHVDDHQVVFTRRLAELDKIHLADSSGTLARLLDAALAEPESFRLTSGEDTAEVAVAEFGRAVSTLFSSAPVPRRLRRRRLFPTARAGSRMS